MTTDGDDKITCPACGFASDDTDDFDVMFSCVGNLFCNRCNCEFSPETGEQHDAAMCPQCMEKPKLQGALFTVEPC